MRTRVGNALLRHGTFIDTESEVLWLIIGAPEEAELLPGAISDKALFYPVDPKQLPKELAGVEWPPNKASPRKRR